MIGAASAYYVRVIVSLPMVVMLAAATLGASVWSFILGGALLFSGTPEPIPFFLYGGLALAALTVPMLIAFILRLVNRGRTYVLVIQLILAPVNLMFWAPFVAILIPQL